MKNLIVFGCAALMAASAFSEAEKGGAKTPVKPRLVRSEAAKRFMDRLGGFVERPDRRPGKVYFVNAQQRVGDAPLTNVCTTLNKMLHTRMEVKTGEAVTPKTAGAALKKLGAVAAIFVVDCKECDVPSLVAADCRWAIVNVGALAADGAEPQFVEARTRKQLMRTFSTLFGSTCSNYDCDLLMPYKSVSDLDKVVIEKPPMDVIVHASKYLTSIDVETRGRATYQIACKEGWAPAPTNEFQKAIWDKYNAKPANPIKIKPGDKPKK